MMLSAIDLYALIPLFIIVGAAMLLLILEVFSVGEDHRWAAHLSVIALGAACYFAFVSLSLPPRGLFEHLGNPAPLVRDAFSSLASLIMIAGALIACLLSPAYIKNARCNSSEYYALLLFALAGMIVMAMAADLITLFLGLETMSIAVYVLTGIRRNDLRASEAALKYFLMGAFATGFLLFGIAFIYGSTASTSLVDLAQSVHAPIDDEPLMLMGLVLLMIGIAFKVAAVPFHLWAPDVYEGAPTPVTGFMAVGVKAAAFVGLLRIVLVGLGEAASDSLFVSFLTALAYMTILGGNALAFVQRSVKRMLAYSSISHAGYALIGVVAATKGEDSAGAAVLFYLGAYTFMTLGAFGVLTFLERKDGGREAERYNAYAGVGHRHPAIGMAMSLFMIALAGMPPTGGFFGKLYLFSAALNTQDYGLVIAGITGSVISVYYYLRVIVSFYMVETPDAGPLPTATKSNELSIGLALAAFAILALGIFPSTWIEAGKTAVESLLG